jgi:outer membrane biosynthesis protein TonB
MSSQVEKTQSDKVNNGALFTLAAAGAAALVAIYFGVTALVRHQASVVGQERYTDADQEVNELRKEQLDKLGKAPHRDPKNGALSVPIDVAMGAVVSDLQRDPRTATAYMPADAGVADAAAAAEDAGAAADAGAEPAPTEEKAPEGQPAPEQPKPEGAPVEEKKPEEPKKPEELKKKKQGALGGAVAPRQPPAGQPAAPAPAPAPPAGDSPY